ncbi:MAG: hemerythrin domain-containing protein [Steroidobacteraceae bacterium]
MSIIDKVVAAVAPAESEESRLKARSKAHASAGKNDWLGMVLDHHEQVETAFAAVKAASEPASKVRTFKKLSTLLTGHSVAEEAALYPALAKTDEKAHATKAYAEQSAAKLQLGLLMICPHESRILGKTRSHRSGRRASRLRRGKSLVFGAENQDPGGRPDQTDATVSGSVCALYGG